MTVDVEPCDVTANGIVFEGMSINPVTVELAVAHTLEITQPWKLAELIYVGCAGPKLPGLSASLCKRA
jgi:hypothetical protein